MLIYSSLKLFLAVHYSFWAVSSWCSKVVIGSNPKKIIMDKMFIDWSIGCVEDFNG